MSGLKGVHLLALLPVACAIAYPQVTIEPSAGGQPRLIVRPSDPYGRNQRVIDIVAAAWDLPARKIIAPEWFAEARYDFSVDAGGADFRPLLKEALEDKFSIIADFQVRPAETWALECPEPRKLAGVEFPRGAGASAGPGYIRGSTQMEGLARLLEHVLKSDVVDECGAGGAFRFSLSWPPGDANALLRALDGAGLTLSREYRDARFLVVYSAYWPDAPKPPRHPCEPFPELKKAIEALPDPDDAGLTIDQRMGPRRNLWEQHPENIFAGLAAQDPIRRNPEFKEWWEWALSAYRGMHDRSAAEFLEARLRMRVDPAHSLGILTSLLRHEPDFGWAHLLAAELAGPGAERERSLRSFRRICGTSLADAPLYADVRDAELLRTAAAAFSRAMAGRTDREALLAYPHYWRIRQRSGPFWPPNWLPIEVAKLRRLALFDDPAWVAAVKAGYGLLGDEASLAALVRRIERERSRP
jgi:uncharacterized protein (TIGR03435 family)